MKVFALLLWILSVFWCRSIWFVQQNDWKFFFLWNLSLKQEIFQTPLCFCCGIPACQITSTSFIENYWCIFVSFPSINVRSFRWVKSWYVLEYETYRGRGKIWKYSLFEISDHVFWHTILGIWGIILLVNFYGKQIEGFSWRFRLCCCLLYPEHNLASHYWHVPFLPISNSKGIQCIP